MISVNEKAWLVLDEDAAKPVASQVTIVAVDWESQSCIYIAQQDDGSLRIGKIHASHLFVNRWDAELAVPTPTLT